MGYVIGSELLCTLYYYYVLYDNGSELLDTRLVLLWTIVDYAFEKYQVPYM